MKRISNRSKKIFRTIGLQRFENLALVRTAINGHETDVIATITKEGSDYIIDPLLLVVTKPIFRELTSPV